VRTYLERERYPVVSAGDGRAALRAIEEHAPRLVVLDLMLPEVDGLAVIRRARQDGDTPILVLSARGAVGDDPGLTEGADDYLPPSRCRPSRRGSGRSDERIRGRASPASALLGRPGVGLRPARGPRIRPACPAEPPSCACSRRCSRQMGA
jgi:hypothetical protein